MFEKFEKSILDTAATMEARKDESEIRFDFLLRKLKGIATKLKARETPFFCVSSSSKGNMDYACKWSGYQGGEFEVMFESLKSVSNLSSPENYTNDEKERICHRLSDKYLWDISSNPNFIQ